MAFLSSDLIDELKSRVDLFSLIDSNYRLDKVKKSLDGKSITSCCPFHNDKTPSFKINKEIGRYHCFGCGESGDPIDFLMDHKHLDFKNAIKELCYLAGTDYDTVLKQANEIGNIPSTHRDSTDVHSFTRFLVGHSKPLHPRNVVDNPALTNFLKNNTLYNISEITIVASHLKEDSSLMKAAISVGAIQDGKFKLHTNRLHLPMYRVETVSNGSISNNVFVTNNRLKSLLPVGFYVLSDSLEFSAVYPPSAKNEASSLLIGSSVLKSDTLYVVDEPADYLALSQMGIGNVVCPATCNLNISHLKQISELNASNIIWITNRESVTTSLIFNRLCMFEESLTRSKGLNFIFLKKGTMISSLLTKYNKTDLDFLKSKQIPFFDVMIQAIKSTGQSDAKLNDLATRAIDGYLYKLMTDFSKRTEFRALLEIYSGVQKRTEVQTLLGSARLDSHAFFTELESLSSIQDSTFNIDYTLVTNAKTPEAKLALSHYLMTKGFRPESISKLVLHSNSVQIEILMHLHDILTHGSFNRAHIENIEHLNQATPAR
ncbi:hypothetical protein QXB71_002587 [Vibrio cholerae]|nr:hypothetical protein [Vibrio cholerae]